MFKALFAASRFVVVLAVVATFLGSVMLLVWAILAVLRTVWEEKEAFDFLGQSGRQWVKSADHLGVQFIQITDIILLGTVMYIVSIGLYQLFIDQHLPVPRWLRVRDLKELKRDLIGVTVVLLGVTFLAEAVDWEQGDNGILYFGAAIALVVVALGFILWLTPHEAYPEDDGEARSERQEPGSPLTSLPDPLNATPGGTRLP